MYGGVEIKAESEAIKWEKGKKRAWYGMTVGMS